MSRSIFIAMLTLLLFFTSCSSSTKSELQQEAERRAQLWWNANVARCGEDYYLRVKWLDVFMGAANRRDVLFQFKPISHSSPYQVKENPVTPAESLNGVEWQGSIEIPVIAHRSYDYSLKSWHGWFNGSPQYDSPFLKDNAAPLLGTGFNRENKQWSIGDDGKQSGDNYIKLDCSQIPPG
jgi:hypothetical protein